LNLPDKSISANPLALLQRLLDEPQVVDLIQGLAPEALGKLIRHIGVEDAGGIIALVTTAQLQHLLDEDIWRNTRSGQAENLDSQRLKLWLEIMLESDAKTAVTHLTGLGEDFMVLAFSQSLLVLDANNLEAWFPEEDAGLVDKALEANLTLEFGPYLLVSKDDAAWDAILSLLTELDENDTQLLERILARCQHLSADFIQDHGGLYQVLTLRQQLEDDLGEQREQRRAARGHLAPQDAAHFLQIISLASLNEIVKAQGPDPITRAYFSAWPAQHPGAASESPAAVDAAPLLPRLQAAPLPAAHLPAGGGAVSPTQPLLAALAWLAKADPACHARRMQEIAYLANVLLVGQPFNNRRYRPVEAAQAALEICMQGMNYLLRNKTGQDQLSGNRLLREQTAVKFFKLGWKLQHP
jgi:hypothetical protein